MRILEWNSLDGPGRRDALARPQLQLEPHVRRVAQEVITRVRNEGDAAVRRFTERFDRVWLESSAVTETEFAAARKALTACQITALERAIANVRAFHERQVVKPFVIETENGVRCEELVRPIGAVGLYVPAGTAPLPSTVIMLGVPSRLAGCPTRILCTPPCAGGGAHPAVLTAAELCGIDRVFKVGGAQAIAALGFGTESIPKVDKIFGPGSAWVAAAKALVAQDPEGAACDLPAGPTEVMVVADDSASDELVAADLLAQAEHDALAQAILVTDSRALAESVAKQVWAQLPTLSRGSILRESLAACRAIVVPDLHTAMDVANRYAPEHLMLEVRAPRRWLDEVHNAGAVFLGTWSAEAFGDYCSGTNHVLPTYGAARSSSGLSVRDFLRTMSVQELTQQGLTRLGFTAMTLATLEGLDAHANAVARRVSAVSQEVPMASKPENAARAPDQVGSRASSRLRRTGARS
jgi:histidinol dehydrogenase